MKHLAIAAASAAAIAAAIIAFTHDDTPLSGGAPAEAEHVASTNTLQNQPVSQPAALEAAPTSLPVQAASFEPGTFEIVPLQTAALETALDDPLCDETQAESLPAAAASRAAGDLPEYGTVAANPGTPLRLVGACGGAADQPLGIRGRSDGEFDTHVEGIQVAENRMPTAVRYVPRRPQPLGSGEAAFDLLQTGAVPPASSSVKTSSDYRK